jgi:hypothetical protein
MSKMLNGWIQCSVCASNWRNYVKIAPFLNWNSIVRELIDEGGLFADRGMPLDLERQLRRGKQVLGDDELGDNEIHTFFDWTELTEVLSGTVDAAEQRTFRGDPEYLEALAAQRALFRAKVQASGDDDSDLGGAEFRLLLAVVQPLVDKFGADNVRAVVWVTWW